jgi:phage terminase large subunit
MTEDTFGQEYGAEFRQFAGLVFKEFERSVHVSDFEVDEKYSMECGMDFGNPKPTAFLFAYFDNNDELWVFDEYYRVGSLMRDHVGEILAKRNQYHNSLRWVAGDSAAAQQIQECNHHGLYVTPVNKFNNSIQISIDRVAERLRINAITKRPTIHIHERCGNLIDEFERWKWKEERSSGGLKEEPEDENDHALAALRYLIMHHRKKQAEKKITLGRTYKPRSLRDFI